MKSTSHQIQILAGEQPRRFDLRVKCVLMAVYQIDGKTVLQPLIKEQEAETVANLFRNETLEVWLSNGKNEIAQFDVDILKYKQVMQPLTKCHVIKKTVVCLKNYFEHLVSCEGCPLSTNMGENEDDEC